jgi:DNA mismatch repair protein MutL
MTGRYAVAFLFFELPPDQVDVNVHPTKTEVRFRDAQALYHLTLTALRERLRAQNLTPRLHLPAGISEWEGRASGPWAVGTFRPDDIKTPSLDGVAPGTMLPPSEVQFENARPGQSAKSSFPETTFLTPPSRPPAAGALKAIQLYDSFLVLEAAEGMLVIDQHALHERILFEQLKQRIRMGSLEIQRLLIPEPVDLTAEQAARTLAHREALDELGLRVEDFGGGTLLLTGYPAILGNRSPQSILRAVVDHLVAKDRAPDREQLLNDLLSLMACHAAVKAGDPLTPEEIGALVAQRELATDAHHCRHGRPTALLFSRQELERQFHRV